MYPVKFSQFTFKLVTSFILVTLCVHMSACAGDSYAAKGATKGAVSGAAAGAVGGLISALVFGGDPLDRAARGAVYGGATGAVVGGISGSQVDKQVKAQAEANARAQTEAQAQALTQNQGQAQGQGQSSATQDEELEALRLEIGDDAFIGLSSLADCDHEETMNRAKKARKSKNPNYRLAGLWLETLSYADRHKKKRLRKIVPDIVKEDWDVNNKAEAEAAIRQASADLTEIRREYNLPLVCAT